MAMDRSRRKAGDKQVHEPPDTHTHRTAHAMEGDCLAASAFHQGALVLSHDTVFSVQNTWSTTRLALVMLFPRVTMTVVLAWVGATRWTCVADAHSSRLASRISVGVSAQPYPGMALHGLLQPLRPFSGLPFQGLRWACRPALNDFPPGDNMSLDEVDFDLNAMLLRLCVYSVPTTGNAEVIPELVLASLSDGVIRLSPEKVQGVCTHPGVWVTASNRSPIQG
jgi:hypothetical protein